ncbi:hypothetical protein K492DRAFT_178211 [Lichtheimia hyalospora FSU 10163]|nr:hypothetical protein K492DRAFT_178211 [Lichtheimia hyalospora FSU 10163]
MGEKSTSFLSTRLPSMNLSTPAVYQSNETEIECQQGPPQPKPSTSWTTQMSTLAHRIRDNAASMNAIMTNTSDTSVSESLDRKSISQGMKLVAIAADEFDDGNDTVALEIYLSGIDKILMALPNKADDKTKQALRQKLTSVEERVGILQMAQQQHASYRGRADDVHVQPTPSVLQSLNMAPIMTAVSTWKWATGITTTQEHMTNNPNNILEQREYYSGSSNSAHQHEGVDKFKRAGNIFIEATVSCAILIKQSPLPDILSLLFGYLVHMLIWIDQQYRVTEKAQDLGIECIKFALYMDEQYQLHEFATEALYMFVAAGIRAAVAYKETPREDHGRPTIRIDQGNSSRDGSSSKKPVVTTIQK